MSAQTQRPSIRKSAKNHTAVRRTKNDIKTAPVLTEDSNWHELHNWVSTQIDRVRTLEARTETFLDTAIVRSHLAKMEASTAAEEMVHKVEGLRTKIDRFAHRIYGLLQ